MSNISALFTSSELSLMRRVAKKLKVKIGKLTTWRDRASFNPYYEVYQDGKLIWQGKAYDASEAKSSAISAICSSKCGEEAVCKAVEAV